MDAVLDLHIRTLPGRRRVYLPSDLCSKEGVSHEDITNGQNLGGISNVAYAVASCAKV